MHRWRKVLALLLLVNSLWLVSGCWNWRELNEINIVLGMGIDWDAKTHLVETTAQVANPSGVAGGRPGQGPPAWLITSTGENVFDSIRNQALVAGGKMYWAHVRVILIGEDMAKRSIGPILDFFDRDAELRNTVKLIVVKGRARDILAAKPEGNTIPADIVYDYLKANSAVGKTIDKDVLSILRLLSRFDVLGQHNPHYMVAAIQPAAKEKSGKPFVNEGSAVFYGDRVVGWANPRLTRGHNWIENEITSTILAVKCDEAGKEDLAIEVIESNTEVKPVIRNGRVELDIRVKSRAHLGHSNCPAPMLSRRFLKKLETRGSALIRSEITDVVKFSQQDVKGDIFGLCELIHRKYPEVWHSELKPDWPQEYVKMPVRVSVNLEIKDVGTTVRYSIFKKK